LATDELNGMAHFSHVTIHSSIDFKKGSQRARKCFLLYRRQPSGQVKARQASRARARPGPSVRIRSGRAVWAARVAVLEK
jgi:hypothetical protein